ncbi:uncharacterized protein LOC128269771 [Anopheles cruzii]|uniref:uncharacterized protein LOC128269771 n=1 Tax=Anopheles cruzii TaxID=68878 RepID=UPI0022EC7083|nr:uncharacterized protein LOC128269771 [Anopheles cruzii]
MLTANHGFTAGGESEPDYTSNNNNNNNNNSWHYTDANCHSNCSGYEPKDVPRQISSTAANCKTEDPKHTPKETPLVNTANVSIAVHQGTNVLNDNSRRSYPARPMNAFLIFCKRHRRTVSQHYPLKENRFITKILGEWWKQLQKDQKEPFEKLAQEHKDHLVLNGFRWSKQATAEPETNSDHTTAQQVQSTNDIVPDETDDPHSDENVEAAHCLIQLASGQSAITEFRLADESQMGGLSALLPNTNSIQRAGESRENSFVDEWAAGNAQEMTMKDDGRLGQMNLLSDMETYRNMRQHFFTQSGQTRPGHTTHASVNQFAQAEAFTEAHSPGLAFGRAPRKLKAKRYEAYMKTQQSASPVRKPAIKSRASSTATTQAASTMVNNAMVNTVASGNDGAELTRRSPPSIRPSHSPVALLDLDKRINDLPCMNFTEYLDKKKDQKKRKKPYAFSPNRSKNTTKASFLPSTNAITPTLLPVEMNAIPSHPPASVAPPAPPSSFGNPVVPEKIVGSRKRKVSKEHIVRLHDP